MFICYVDESGGAENPDSGPSATPVMVMLGLIVNAASVPSLTRDFLAIKRKHFAGRFRTGHALDHILTEVKGSEILQMTRSSSRNKRQQAFVFRSELLRLLEVHECKIVGRIWVKESGKSLNPLSTYTYAIQDISTHFSRFLELQDETGIVLVDSREHNANLRVAHSVFTQKWRAGGDPYPAIREVPLFAASDNHAGLQLADLVASVFAFPMAVVGYCPIRTANPHDPRMYSDVRRSFGSRLESIQYRYRDESGRWRGGLVVSDPVHHKPGSHLFS